MTFLPNYLQRMGKLVRFMRADDSLYFCNGCKDALTQYKRGISMSLENLFNNHPNNYLMAYSAVSMFQSYGLNPHKYITKSKIARFGTDLQAGADLDI